MKKTLFTIIIIISTIFCYGQNIIKGTITEDGGEPLIGASILVVGTVSGTVTDLDGNYQLSISQSLPVSLTVSYTGYEEKTVIYDTADEVLNIVLENRAEVLGEVIVSSASRVDENILEAPVTIEKVNLTELRTTPSFDAYSTLNSLKGVQASTGSLTFTSINTRGFADMQNWRFVQLLDGMDASAPGLNYPLGGNSGPADIDIASMELVPGANSALYGANAFNGLLTIKTKNPFYYTGLSAYVKVGATNQRSVDGSNPLTDIGFRYAQNVNDKFAYKINFGYMTATDWEANSEEFYIGNTIATTQSQEAIDALRSTPRDDPNFDAVNVYGDEITTPVALGTAVGDTVNINRTGIAERDIIDYSITTIKGDASLHYRISDKVEASYGYRYIQSNGILRHTTIYPLRNWTQQFHRAELKGANWNLKTFLSTEDARDSYAMLVTGRFIEEGRKSSTLWGQEYGNAFRGEVEGVAGGSHAAAREFADRDLPGVDSDIFQSLRTATLTNPNIAEGGSKFIDNSKLFSVDGNYDFASLADVLDLKVGANFRRYSLDSQGQLFNDGAEGFNAPIPVAEFGAYIQAGKNLVNDRLRLRGSLRLDKHQDFEVKVTPRISAVLGLDENRKHNLRASFQTGFRNPGSQEGYINLAISPVVYLLGGIRNNLENLTVNGESGLDIHARLGEDFLVQEKNTTYEFGYKGVIGGKLLIDLNYYNTTYDDLVVRLTRFDLAGSGRVYLLYTNIDDQVTSSGVGFGLDYLIGNGFKAGFNYTYTKFDAETAVENTPGFLPSFNTPENRFNVSFSGSRIGNSNFGFNLKYRYWDEYIWQSPFGAGPIESGNVVDLAINYKIPGLSSMIKVGATNLVGDDYRTVYGGPAVGSMYYVSWTYDQMFSK